MDVVLKLAADLLLKMREREQRHQRLLENCHQKMNVTPPAHELKTERVRDEKYLVGCSRRMAHLLSLVVET